MFRSAPRAVWHPVCAGLALVALTSLAGPKDGALDIYWIDSEGGGSTLIVSPVGEGVLIDAGNPGGRDSARIHRVATEVAGLRQIDHLIVTHFHIDHFGGAAELAALIPIRTLWDNGLPDLDPDGRRESPWPLTSKPYREMRVGARQVVQPGLTLPLRATTTGLELRCHIARQQPWMTPEGNRRPGAGSSEPPGKAPDTSDNANSSAWVLTFGGFQFFDGGDLSWNTEAKLIWPQILVPEVDLLQVTHHGLDVSNHPQLLRALNPTVSVMNNGPTKGTMAEVIQTLRALPSLKAQYQVHKNIRPDGVTNNCPETHIANHEKDCPAHYIHCAVADGGASYTISIPSSGHRSTFTTR